MISATHFFFRSRVRMEECTMQWRSSMQSESSEIWESGYDPKSTLHMHLVCQGTGKAFLCRVGMQKLSRLQQHWRATYFNTEQHSKIQDETYKKWKQWVGWDGLGGTCQQTWQDWKETESKCAGHAFNTSSWKVKAGELCETHNMGHNEIPTHLVRVGWRKSW